MVISNTMICANGMSYVMTHLSKKSPASESQRRGLLYTSQIPPTIVYRIVPTTAVPKII